MTHAVRLLVALAVVLGTAPLVLFSAPLLAQTEERRPPVIVWSLTGSGVNKMGEIAVNVGDLDQDGYEDIAVGGSGNIEIFAGSESGLAATPELAVTDFDEAPAYVDGLLAGNFDGDDEIDLLLSAPFEESSQGAIYLYPGSSAGSGTPWTLRSSVADSLLGKGIDRGDFNGDGYDDLVVSAPATHNAEVAGQVLLYYGSPRGLSEPTEPALVLTGTDPALRYGDVVRNVGDLNGDGYDDLIIQAEDDTMRVDLHPGSADGIAAEPLTSLYAQEYDFIFADSVAALGDVNGDGYTDFAVAAVNIDDLLIAYLVYGAAEWEALASESIQLPDTDRMDLTVNGVGDVDGDGYADLAMAMVSPTYRDEGTSTVYIFGGDEAGVALDPTYALSTDVIADGFGSRVVAADVDGDGLSELLIGAPGDTAAGDFAGKAYLYSFSADAVAIDEMTIAAGGGLQWEPSRIQEILSPDEDDLAGIQPTALGDINGDGYDDLGAFGMRGTGEDINSYIAILLGSEEGLPNQPDLAAAANNWRAALGDVEGELSFWHLAAVGDVNGDGFADFGVTMLTDSGDAVLIFAGGEDEPEEEPIGILWPPDYDPATADDYPYYFAEQLYAAGDVNGDGFGDIVAYSTAVDEGGEELFTLYLGSADGVTDEVVWQQLVGPTLPELRPTLAAAGDVDGDGYDDLLIGEPFLDDDGDATTSALMLFAGGADGPAREPSWLLESGAERQLYGASLLAAGDVEGNGDAELLTSVLYETGLKLVQLPGTDVDGWQSALETATNSLIEETYLGLGLLPAGDVNGDGYADVIAGNTPNGLDEEVDTVYWELLLGGAEGLSTNGSYTMDHPLTTMPDPTVDVDGGLLALMFGAHWQPGDFNGDGYSDLVFGYSDPASHVTDLAGETPAPLTIYYGGPMMATTDTATESAMTVVDVTEITVDAATVATLSPDGQWLFIDRLHQDEEATGTELCLIEVEDMGDECDIFPDVSTPNKAYVTWSNDSRYVVMAEDAGLTEDADVWLFDLDTGDDTNLSALFPIDEDDIGERSDSAPVISPTAPQVAFVRNMANSTALLVHHLETEAQMAWRTTAGTIGNVRWLANGDGLVYTFANPDATDENGLWYYAFDGNGPVQLYQSPVARGLPYIVSMLEGEQAVNQGPTLLLTYPFALDNEDPTTLPYELVALPAEEDGETVVVELTHGAAAIAPDGSHLLTMDYDVDEVAGTLAQIWPLTGLRQGEASLNNATVLTAFDEYYVLAASGLRVDWYTPQQLFVSDMIGEDIDGVFITLE